VGIEIVIDPALHRRLLDSMTASELEEVAFLAARGLEDGHIEAFDLLAVPPRGFVVQTDYHVRLHDAARAEVIKWAHDRSATLIEAHAHRGPWAAAFSSSDLAGLREWVPHVCWRLGYPAYAALIFADGSFDVLAWGAGRDGSPIDVSGLRVGDQLLLPTRLTNRARMELGPDDG
jgi:hypothetical protein